jgi:peptidoglycan/LPS O-acetylase OafA/YrhL
VATYLLKRGLRILPAYWTTVVLAYVLVPSDIGRGTDALLRNLTLTHIYGANFQHLGLTQMWSLASECAFYLVLPLIAWVLCSGLARGRWRPGRLYAGCVLLAAAGAAWFLVTRQVWVPDATTIWWLPNFLSWFAVGMALAVAAVQHERRPLSPRGLAAAAHASPGSFWAVALALMAIASTPLAGEATLMPLPLWDSLLKNMFYAVIAGLFMVPLVLGDESRLTGWLRSRPAQWLGRISYPIFLLHLIVIEGVVRVLDYPTFTGSLGYVLGCTLAATVAAAWVMHRLVEVPVSRWRPGRPEVTAAPLPAHSGRAPR